MNIDLLLVFRLLEFLCGVYYLIFGIDGFVKKIPLPTPSPAAIQFLSALENSKYILPLVKSIEIGVGLCFIFQFQQPLAWCLLSPIVVNILGYHFFLNKKEIVMPLVILISHLIMGIKYYSHLRFLIQ